MPPKTEQPFIETDASGCLYDRRMRENILKAVPPEEAAASEALAAMRMASHGFRTMMDRWLERHGMSEGRLSVLWLLRVKSAMTLGELAERLDVSPRNITGLVDHLEQDALVERFPDPDDRRAVQVRLAPAGKLKLSQVKKEMGSSRYGVVAGFTDEELIQLRHLCLKLVQNMNASKELERV